MTAVKIDGHYDRHADVAWLRSEDYDSNTVVSEEIEAALREVDPATGRLVGLEYWQASQRLPRDLLAKLRPPTVPKGA